MSKGNTAFEVVGCAVVLATLGFLLLPSVADRRGISGQAASDAQNLHSLGQLFYTYSLDHDGQLPGPGLVWPVELHKMGAEYKCLKSPFDRREKVESPNAPVSYGMNGRLLGMRTADFVSPSRLFFMADAAQQGPKGAVFPGLASENVAVHPETTIGVYRNGSFLNVLFADFHVQPIQFDSYRDVITDAGKTHWDPLYKEPATP